MKTPLTNMENRWVYSTKEAFDALVAMGYCTPKEYLGCEKLEVLINKIIFQGSFMNMYSKQAYYHNGHFYDQPYEEFTITEDKVPFPELDDIEWAMVDAPEWMLDTSFRFGGGFVFDGVHHIYMNNTKDDADKMFVRLNKSEYSVIKELHENSKDFKVTWKLKEKINLRNDLISKFIDDYCETSTCEENMTVDLNNLIDQVLQWMKEYDHTS